MGTAFWFILTRLLTALKINENKMKIKSLALGVAGALALGSSAFAERGSDGNVGIIYWQAPSILNPYLSGGTKDIES